MGRGAHRAWRLAGWGVAVLVGAALQLHERSLSPPAAYAAAMVVGLAMCAWPVCLGRRWWVVMLGAALLSGGAAGWRATQRLADALPAALEGQDVQITGVVASLPQRSPSGLRFHFEAEAAQHRGEPVRVPRHLLLGWYAGWHEEASLSEAQLGLRAGQRWRFVVRLRQPHGNVNPHGFDYELHLFEQGVRATGHVRDAGGQGGALLIDDRAGHPVDRLRQRVRDAIEAAVPDRRVAGVLAALAVGDQSAIERDDWQLFRDTGVAHLMSISGLHVTMFAWLASTLIGVAWRRSPRAMLWWPTPWAARVGGVAAALAYAVFSGWGVPAQRTVWMLATVAVLQLSGRRWPWPLVLLAAACVVCACDPWALLQPGFWLSFVAVGMLMASGPVQRDADDPATGRRSSRWQRLRGTSIDAARVGLRTQLVATVGLTPLTLVFFQQVSVVGFLANLVAIPIVTLVVTPLALAGVVAPPLWLLAAWVQGALTQGLALLASWPLAVWVVPVAPGWAQAAGLAGAGLLVLPWPWQLRLLAVPMLMPLMLPVPASPPHGRFELVAVDVGQGTAVLVRTHRHLLVYDAGPQYSRESDAGERVLLPLLRARGERRIHRLVLSHRDLDHVGGAAALLAGLPVDELLSSLEDGHPLRQKVARAMRCEDGQSWVWDGIRFELLHPLADDHARGLKPNGLSCVIKVSGEQGSVLLTGDIERAQEAELVARHGESLRSDVLLVPHHGSRTSTTPAFVEAVQARVAVVQAGYRNRFGHPVPEVLARLRAQGTQVESSPVCGAWHWAGDEAQAASGVAAARIAQPAGQCERDITRRYWRHVSFGE